MQRGAIESARRSTCAPSSGDGDPDVGPARTRRRGGIRMPSGGPAGLLALTIIGLVGLSNDDPVHDNPPMRLILGKPRTMTAGFALSPDGRTIATTRSDGRVSLRDHRGIERVLDLHGWPWGGLAFSPDGRFLAVGRDKPGIPIFDLAAGVSWTVLSAEISRSKAVAFSPNGRSLAASTDHDGRILLWDLAAGRIRMRLRGRFPALDLAFSPDGRSLAAGERGEARVTLWDLGTGRGRSIFRASSGVIASVAFSPDGSLLAAAGPTDRVVRLWELSSGRLRYEIVGHPGGTNAVRFSPDSGLLITSGSEGMVRIWKVETGELIAGLDGYSGHSLVLGRLFLSADGRMIAATAGDNDVRVWDLGEIDEVRVHRAGKGTIHRARVTSEIRYVSD
jgi:WD40 repeat protein